MLARRKELASILVQPTTHAGLWLDKYLTDQPVEGVKDERATAAKATMIQQVSQIGIPTGYRESFDRRRKLFSDLKDENLAEVCTSSVEGRMIIGLGQKGPVEAGLALEHTWGVPTIPGSALKGLTIAAAHLLLEDEEWQKRVAGRGRSLALLGGTTEHIGNVIFHDAWWIPEGEKLPIHPDVMTVHHADYYKDGAKTPSDMDNPKPVPFASVTGKYLVVVEKTSPRVEDELLDAALYILKLGLEHLGIGAKTNAGYGRMLLDFECEAERQRKEADEGQAQAERLRQKQEDEQRKAQQQQLLAQRDAQNQLRKVAINNAAQTVPSLLSSFTDTESRRAFAEQLVNQLTKKAVLAKVKESKSWAIELLKEAGMEV